MCLLFTCKQHQVYQWETNQHGQGTVTFKDKYMYSEFLWIGIYCQQIVKIPGPSISRFDLARYWKLKKEEAYESTEKMFITLRLSCESLI